jgi:hypothetical protein
MIGDRFQAGGSDYGVFKHSGPIGALIHDLEAPPKNGMAAGLVQWVRSAKLSPHTMSDPGEIMQVLDERHAGAHAGGNANMSLVGFEVTGYASYTADQWTSGDCFAGVRNQARAVANLWKVMGWDRNNVEWGSVGQLQAAYNNWSAGRPFTPMMWTHYDVTRAWSQTTHTDPGPGFPYSIFRQMVKQYLGTWQQDQVGTPGATAVGTGGAETDWLSNSQPGEHLGLWAEVLRSA